MLGDHKLQKLGEAYNEACSPAMHSDSGDSVQESERLINLAYENTLNMGHPTPPAEDLNRKELKSGRSYHTIPQERDPTYQHYTTALTHYRGTNAGSSSPHTGNPYTHKH